MQDQLLKEKNTILVLRLKFSESLSVSLLCVSLVENLKPSNTEYNLFFRVVNDGESRAEVSVSDNGFLMLCYLMVEAEGQKTT